MPLYSFVCPICGVPDKRLLSAPGSTQDVPCRKTDGCPGVLVRDVVAPALHHKEVIDNSIMVRQVERFVDVEKLVHERAHKDHRKPD